MKMNKFKLNEHDTEQLTRAIQSVVEGDYDSRPITLIFGDKELHVTVSTSEFLDFTKGC